MIDVALVVYIALLSTMMGLALASDARRRKVRMFREQGLQEQFDANSISEDMSDGAR